VNLLAVLQRGGPQGQQAVGARLRVRVQVGQGLLTPGLDVGQGPAGALEERDTPRVTLRTALARPVHQNTKLKFNTALNSTNSIMDGFDTSRRTSFFN